MRFIHERDGSIGLIIVVVLLVLGLLGSLGFGFWAFSERTTYKNDYDRLAADAVDKALVVQKEELQAEFDEKEKQPFESYTGPSELGSLVLVYPRTWELYVDTSSNNGAQLNGYAHPSYVPTLNGDTSFALRFRVVDQDYATVLSRLDNSVRRGTIKVSPYRAERIPDALGSKIEGEVDSRKTGTKVLLPLRDKTIEIWTEGPSFVADFNTLLANLTFVP